MARARDFKEREDGKKGEKNYRPDTPDSDSSTSSSSSSSSGSSSSSDARSQTAHATKPTSQTVATQTNPLPTVTGMGCGGHSEAPTSTEGASGGRSATEQVLSNMAQQINDMGTKVAILVDAIISDRESRARERTPGRREASPSPLRSQTRSIGEPTARHTTRPLPVATPVARPPISPHIPKIAPVKPYARPSPQQPQSSTSGLQRAADSTSATPLSQADYPEPTPPGRYRAAHVPKYSSCAMEHRLNGRGGQMVRALQPSPPPLDGSVKRSRAEDPPAHSSVQPGRKQANPPPQSSTFSNSKPQRAGRRPYHPRSVCEVCGRRYAGTGLNCPNCTAFIRRLVRNYTDWLRVHGHERGEFFQECNHLVPRPNECEVCRARRFLARHRALYPHRNHPLDQALPRRE
uniref:Uncharacterized protein n=1 Tax=Lygus hesperus TaxID=30085 RepID=A0A146KRT5_LYGHE